MIQKGMGKRRVVSKLLRRHAMTKILISTQELSTLDISYKAPVSMASHMCLISQVKKASQELSCIPQSIQALHRIGPVKK